jgi:hypothetical protein
VSSLPDTASDFDVGNDSFSTLDLDSSSECECNYTHTGIVSAESQDAHAVKSEETGSQSTIIRSYVPFVYDGQHEEDVEDEAPVWRYYGFEEDGTTARSSVDEWALLRRENFFR